MTDASTHNTRALPPALCPKKQPRQTRAQVTFDAIVEASGQLLARSGYDALTTNHIAEVAGVSIGSLYEYFPNKQSIVATLIARITTQITREVSTSLRTALALPDQPRSGIDYWMRAMIQALEKQQTILRVALQEVPFLWDIPEVRNLSATLQHIASEGGHKSQNMVRFDDPEASTFLLMTMTWAAILQSVLYRPAHLSRERLTHTLVEMVLKLL
ncbi:TetR/AcrR family transcriptional regulator [Sinimarinibacterium sp. NLF-5-8]|uniref:TetR/AcrR family transcriptional regulator n=1 Tax=Sinimarinibacterium sp. NLF-5-8 TaxID=2698684 RepID=UPI00137C2FF7|nr:TetR/AcrR family transcriptional regulator [Sinimarinibacterium sp. NLF-5-8]QHS10814.1 TetR/AcrR family transcriptional regulator [Sinimarinibacterium sp. NLF-5-8]